MRFTLGFVLGVVVGRPILSVVSDYLTPPVRSKIAEGVNNFADYLNARIEDREQGDEK